MTAPELCEKLEELANQVDSAGLVKLSYGPAEQAALIRQAISLLRREGMVSKQDSRLAMKLTIRAFCDGLENKRYPTAKELLSAWDAILGGKAMLKAAKEDK